MSKLQMKHIEGESDLQETYVYECVCVYECV